MNKHGDLLHLRAKLDPILVVDLETVGSLDEGAYVVYCQTRDAELGAILQELRDAIEGPGAPTPEGGTYPPIIHAEMYGLDCVARFFYHATRDLEQAARRLEQAKRHLTFVRRAFTVKPDAIFGEQSAWLVCRRVGFFKRD